MRRNPLFIFQNADSQGIYDVPLKSTVHVINVDNMGTPMFLQLVAKVGLYTTSTIADLLRYPEDYIDLFTVGENYSELELINEDDKTGWRILDRNPEHYGNIGTGAFDFSYNDADSLRAGAVGDYSFVTGKYSAAWADNGFVTGIGTLAGYEDQTAMGSWNRNIPTNAFEFGIGTGVGSDQYTRMNALEISRTGVVLAPSMEVTEVQDQRTLITKEYLENFSSGGQLLKITENGNTGWRIAGRNIENYDNIGPKAVDLSWSSMRGDFNGASGASSFAAGFNVIARAPNGTALGRYNEDYDDTVLEIGNGEGTVTNRRSNALEVYMDGRVRAPSLELPLIDNPKSLVTMEYIQSSFIHNILEDIDINTTNIGLSSYGVTVDSGYSIDSIEVFMNGILLRKDKNYGINIVATGIEVSFVSFNYTLHLGDWLRIKIPHVEY